MQINNLKNKIVLGTDANGTLKDATSGDYNHLCKVLGY